MEISRIIMLVALSLFLLEGFTLSMFPTHVQEWLAQADPRSVQLTGLLETILAVGLMGGILFG